MRPCVLAASALAALMLAGCGGGSSDKNGSQSFVGKTDSVVLYVTWTRSGNDLTGSLTQGTLPAGKTQVATKRGALTGTVSGDTVTVDVANEYGEKSRLNGTLSGDSLALEYLSGSSGVTTVRMEPAGADEFNVALAGLSDSAGQAQADAQTAAADNVERNRVIGHSDAVIDDLAALMNALTASLPAKGSSYRADLARLQSTLRSLKDHARAALSADRLSVCSSAALVQSDAQAIESGVAALQTKQERVTTGTTAVNDAIKKLTDDFTTLQDDDRKYLPDDAPVLRTVSRAVRDARRKLRKFSSSGTDPGTDVNAMLQEAQSLNTQTAAACRTGGA
ncbi:MAG: hypothetical protein QOG15_2073 [Solirubrobacteraceae bacterium]|jgi:hypothetical protein|nr:hypothetical protein [Solirubrobacteraceae bacterium]